MPTYIATPWFDNGTYGGSRISKDILFDESCVFDKYIDNSPTDGEFAALPHIIENLHPEPVAVVKKVKFEEYEQHNTNVLPTPAGLPVAESPCKLTLFPEGLVTMMILSVGLEE